MSNRVAQCPKCGRLHQITERDWDLFGPDCWCITCCDWQHVEFMQTTGRRLNMTCSVPGCRCGAPKPEQEAS